MNFNKLVITLIFGLLGTAGAVAQVFPQAPVRLIIPFPPGGPTDTVGRIIAKNLQNKWGQPVVVDYKPGAGTIIGVDYVSKAKPDGLTIGMVNTSLAINPFLYKNLPYDTKRDITGVTQLFNLQIALVTYSDAPYNTLSEFIEYARKNPGKMNYGTSGAGSTNHLGVELLKKEANFSIEHVAMKGSAPAHVELMTKRLDLVADPVLSVLPFVETGKMKMLATMGAKPVEGHNFPTVSSTVPKFNVGGLLGFVVPAGTPREIVKKIQQDTFAALHTADLTQRARDFGFEIVGSTPEEFGALIFSEMDRWGKIIPEIGLGKE